MRKASQEKNTGEEAIEPFIRTTTDGNCFHLIAELAGISEEKIRIDLEKTTLVISAMDGGRSVRKEIFLPWKARFGKKRFQDGILELTLEKTS
jgi:HSP20 family molecular chaperone IbpA